MKLLLNVFLLSLLLVFPACARAQSDEMRAKPEPGVYTSYTTQMNTRLEMGYAVGPGYRLQPRNTIRRSPSALGDLHLKRDGTYTMPVPGHTGQWRFDPAMQAVNFTGGLKGTKATSFVSQSKYYVAIELTSPEGGVSTLTFEKLAESPIPDLIAPNNNFKGRLVYFDGDATLHFDVASGKTLKRFETAAPGWPGGEDLTLFVIGAQTFDTKGQVIVQVRDADGTLISEYSGAGKSGRAWGLDYYSIGEVSPDGKKFLLNGTRIISPVDPNNPFANFGKEPEFVPTVLVLDGSGEPITQFAARGGYTASWVDANQILIPSEAGGVALYDLRTEAVSEIVPDRVNDAIASPDGKQILMRSDARLRILDRDSGVIRTVTFKGEELELDSLQVRTMRWSPDQTTVLLGTQIGSDNTYQLILVALDGSLAQYVRHAAGDPVEASSLIMGWTR